MMEMRGISRLLVSRDVLQETNAIIPDLHALRSNSEDAVKHFTVDEMVVATVWVQPTGADPKAFFKELGKYLGVRDEDVDAYDALVSRFRPVLEEILALRDARDKVRAYAKDPERYLRCEGGGSIDLRRYT